MKGAIYILTALFLFGCADQHIPKETDKLTAFVSIPPQAGLLKAIAGDVVSIHTLAGEGQSPHAYEPTARQLARLGEADVLLTIGVPFEQHLLKKIIPLYPDLPIVNIRDGIELRSMPHRHHGEHCTDGHGAQDPHIWLSPSNTMTLAKNLFMALQKIDPSNKEIYQKNYGQLADQLKQLNLEITERLSPYKGCRFYVFHPSFGYFSDAYGLKQIPIELDGKSPSSRQLVGLIEQAQRDEVRVVFVQKQFPSDSAKAIADAINGRVVPLDPLAEDSIANLRLIADSIAQALEK